MGIKQAKQSFSLIEMVIVVGVLGLALPVLFAIVFVIIQQQVRIYALQEIKKQGDQALFSMKTTIRQYGAVVAVPTLIPTIADLCPIYPTPSIADMTALYLYDRDLIGFQYELKNNKVASNSADNNIIDRYLTDDKVVISNLKFNCYRTNQFSPPIVSLRFRVTKSGGYAGAPYLDYGTRFQLKSY